MVWKSLDCNGFLFICGLMIIIGGIILVIWPNLSNIYFGGLVSIIYGVYLLIDSFKH